MSSFFGVVPMAEFTDALLPRLAALRVRPTGAVGSKRLLIDVPTFEVEVLEGLARKVALATAAPAFVLLGQTSVDNYVAAEVTASEVVRRVEYSGDAEPNWSQTGSSRPWEADLYFRKPIGELVGDGTDDPESDWSPTEVEALRSAHATRNPQLLTRLPPLSRSDFEGFADSLGVDLAHPGASWKPPGFFARLFGRG